LDRISTSGGSALSARGSARFSGLTRKITPLLFLAPAIALLVWLMVIPLFEAVHLSFTRWEGFGDPQWIGLQNYQDLIHDHRFKSALLHNLAVLLAIPIWVLVPYGISWALYSRIPGWRFFRFAFFLPVVLSPVVIGVYYGIVLKPDGPFNELLQAIGLGGLVRPWLNDPATALPVVIAIIIWSTFGAGVLIFLGGLANLDQEQVDAARVDGASGWQIQRHVIFWRLLPIFEFWTILIVIITFTALFPLIYTLTRGGPGFSTYTVDYDLYQEAFTTGQLGYASAIGVVLLAVIAIVGGLVIGLLRWRRA
jgi:ABC-type sugar transport system permease subunit